MKSGRLPSIVMKTSTPFSVLRRTVALATTAAVVLLPMVVISGLLSRESARAADRKAAVAPHFVLRCWQDGRLIVEESQLALPPGIDLDAAKLRLVDDDSRTLYVAETRTATCLVRADGLVPARRDMS